MLSKSQMPNQLKRIFYKYRKNPLPVPCLLIVCILLLSGCGTSVRVEPNFQSGESGKDPMSEYGLFYGDIYYAVNEICRIEIPDLEIEEFEAESGFFGGRSYTADGLRIHTTYTDEGKTSEKPLLMVTTDEGRTLRGIGIGDSLAELQSAYEQLEYVYTFGYSPERDPVKYDRVYAYALEEDSFDYLVFYLYDKTIVMIEAGDSFGLPPGGAEWDSLLGYDKVIKEMDNGYPEYFITRYYSVDENMQESLLFEFNSPYPPLSESDEREYPWHIVETDLDEDGIYELVVDLVSGNALPNVGIYHLVDGDISYLDVNKSLGSAYCRQMTSVSYKSEYIGCFEVGFAGETGTEEDVLDNLYVYAYRDKQLVEITPYTDAVFRWAE